MIRDQIIVYRGLDTPVERESLSSSTILSDELRMKVYIDHKTVIEYLRHPFMTYESGSRDENGNLEPGVQGFLDREERFHKTIGQKVLIPLKETEGVIEFPELKYVFSKCGRTKIHLYQYPLTLTNYGFTRVQRPDSISFEQYLVMYDGAMQMWNVESPPFHMDTEGVIIGMDREFNPNDLKRLGALSNSLYNLVNEYERFLVGIVPSVPDVKEKNAALELDAFPNQPKFVNVELDTFPDMLSYRFTAKIWMQHLSNDGPLLETTINMLNERHLVTSLFGEWIPEPGSFDQTTIGSVRGMNGLMLPTGSQFLFLVGIRLMQLVQEFKPIHLLRHILDRNGGMAYSSLATPYVLLPKSLEHKPDREILERLCWGEDGSSIPVNEKFYMDHPLSEYRFITEFMSRLFWQVHNGSYRLLFDMGNSISWSGLHLMRQLVYAQNTQCDKTVRPDGYAFKNECDYNPRELEPPAVHYTVDYLMRWSAVEKQRLRRADPLIILNLPSNSPLVKREDFRNHVKYLATFIASIVFCEQTPSCTLMEIGQGQALVGGKIAHFVIMLRLFVEIIYNGNLPTSDPATKAARDYRMNPKGLILTGMSNSK